MPQLIKPYITNRINLEELGKLPDVVVPKPPKSETPSVESTEQEVKPKTPPKIITADKYWEFENVDYKNRLYKVQLLKELLPSGTQDEIAKYSLEAKAKGEFYCGDFPLNIAIFDAVEQTQNSEARAFIQSVIRTKYPNTLTRIIYNPSGLDKIIHNYKMPDEYFFDKNVVGKDDWIKNISDKDILEFLTGRNHTQLNKIFRFINGTDTYISRVNSKPNSVDERIAWLYAGLGRAGLGFGGGPSAGDPCFGVKIVDDAGG